MARRSAREGREALAPWPVPGYDGSAIRTLQATLIAVGLSLLFTTPASAVVANPAAPDGAAGSLRQVVAAAAANETVELPPGTYRLTQGPLEIGKGLTLVGQGARAAEVVITAEGRSRVLSVTAPPASIVNVRRLEISGGSLTGATGAGVLKDGTGTLNLEEVTISGNSVSGSQGGGGLSVNSGTVNVVRSTVAGNSATVSAPSSGGGGILQRGLSTVALTNASLAGNRVAVSGSPAGAGGSAVLRTSGTLSLDSVTVAYNSSSPGGLGALRSELVVGPTLVNTLLVHNGGDCVGTFASNGFNIDSDDSCDLNEPDDRAGLVTAVERLADNGGPTPTLRLPPGSQAINAGTCTVSEDQRNALRPADNETSCDVGAFEFEGWAMVEVPPCSRSGQLPFSVFSPPETQVEALDYTIDGGSTLNPLRILLPAAPSATGTITIPEGRRRLEYWADSFPTGTEFGVQLKHATPLVVVDRTDPNVTVSNPNDFRVFVIKRRANVQVSASDSISGLTVDPSGRPTLDTSRRGTRTFAPGAMDLCNNTAQAPFSYRVLAPGLGVRTVLERLRGRVVVQPAAGRSSGARASQKGRRFTTLREPRELPVRSLIDTRRGTARLTSSRDTRTTIQDGEFRGGVFQVLQSRRRSARGLTELRLKGSSFRRCGRASGRASAAQRRRVIRRLRGNARGRFRTRGRFSSATVRGTVWTVEDRCDGTLTKVTRGRVAVRDFARRKTIILRAGKSHLAKRR